MNNFINLMYCRNCGTKQTEKTLFCSHCDMLLLIEKNYCSECGEPTKPEQAECKNCGESFDPRKKVRKILQQLQEENKEYNKNNVATKTKIEIQNTRWDWGLFHYYY